MFKIVRFPKKLDSFFDSLENSFHWNHAEYFKTFVLLMAFAWGRRNVSSLYRHLDERNWHHRSRFNNFLSVLRWPAQQVLQMKASDLIRMLKPKPGDTLLLILDDLGTQSATPWAREKLFQIVNFRYNARLPTVITTADEIENIDPRLRARFLDVSRCMLFAIIAQAYHGGGGQKRRRSRQRRVPSRTRSP